MPQPDASGMHVGALEQSSASIPGEYMAHGMSALVTLGVLKVENFPSSSLFAQMLGRQTAIKQCQ
jgi:hypothetical protein